MNVSIRNLLGNTGITSVSLNETDWLPEVYNKVGSLLGLKSGSFILLHDDSILEESDTEVCETALVSGSELVVAMGPVELARQKLKDRGISVEDTVLFDAAGRDDLELVQLFVEAKVSTSHRIKAAGFAIAGWSLPCLKILLSSCTGENALDAPVTFQFDDYRYGPGPLLVIACEIQWVEGVRELLAAGANPNQGSALYTPLATASLLDVERLAEILLSYGADPNQLCASGRTPLYIAASRGAVAVVRLLVDRGADFEHKLSDGSTPLLRAACLGRLETVEYLLSLGAAVDPTDEDGRSALYWAIRNGFVSVAMLLVRAGADLDKAEIVPQHATPRSLCKAHSDMQAVVSEYEKQHTCS